PTRCCRRRLELRARRPGGLLGRGPLRLVRVAPQRLDEPPDRLAPHRQPLRAASHPVERRGCRLATAGGILELVLGPPPLDEERLEPLVAPPPREPGRRPPLLELREPLLETCGIERREPRLERRNLRRELLRPLGRGHLERERPDPRPHLLLDVVRPLDLRRDARELQLGA